MSVRSFITGQKINFEKVERAKQLRRKMTPAEHLLWQALRRSSVDGLHFRRQQVIAGFIVDFYCHSGSLVVEIDGPIHESQRESDAERDAIMSNMELRVLRISNDEVMSDLPAVIRKIIAHAKPNPRPRPQREGEYD
jgi:very-short-patch-repair endonuclease